VSELSLGTMTFGEEWGVGPPKMRPKRFMMLIVKRAATPWHLWALPSHHPGRVLRHRLPQKKLYHSLDDLRADLDDWLREYNLAHTHSGNYCYGKHL
jgi:hypothetical protein